MLIELDSKYYYLSKRMTGQNLKLFFTNHPENTKPSHILDLIGIIGFIENGSNNNFHSIEIVMNASVYALDLSMFLHKPDIRKYQEVFIFNDSKKMHTTFRALAKKIIWRPFDNNSVEDLNY